MTDPADNFRRAILLAAVRTGMSPERTQTIEASMDELDAGLESLTAADATDDEKLAYIRQWQTDNTPVS